MLTSPELYGKNGSTVLVCTSVLSLVASLMTTNMDYAGRSRDMYLNYRKIQRISVELEQLRLSSANEFTEKLNEISNHYQDILDETENHTSGDFRRNFPKNPSTQVRFAIPVWLQKEVLQDTVITLLPYSTLAVPIIILVPFLRMLTGS